MRLINRCPLPAIMALNDQQSDHFMDLQQLNKQLNKQLTSLDNEPPFEQWHPTVCGDIDILIKQDGTWHHEGTQITRLGLIKLLANVLIKENGDYYLKTPIEKMRIQVEDAPFVITQWQQLTPTNSNEVALIQVSSNLDHQVILSEQHPLMMNHSNADDVSLYVELHRKLTAKVHRNVYYQWAEIAQEQKINGQRHFVIQSGTQHYSIGTLD